MLAEKHPYPWYDLFQRVSEVTGQPAALLAAICRHESDFNPKAVSPAGALGLMQLTQVAVDQLGYNHIPTDPYENIKAAAYYLAYLQSVLYKYLEVDRYAFLAAYVWGIGNVLKKPKIEQWPREVQRYVANVLYTAYRYALQEK